MSRRVSLPTADDLFRPTREEDQSPETTAPPVKPAVAAVPNAPDPDDTVAAEEDREDAAKRRSSGRVRHDEKMTVYVTADELLDLEHARLSLRREHGLAVDRGRLVREAIAMALADLDRGGEDSILVQRLSAS